MIARIGTARHVVRSTAGITACVASRCALVATAVAVIMAVATPRVQAQEGTGTLVSRAIEHENAGRHAEAIATWREAIKAGAVLPGVLGLERTYAMIGDEAALLPLLDSLIPASPADAQMRGVQLRTLVVAGRDAEARRAFAAWRDLRPQDVTPYRDYARVLLFNNRIATADSVLAEAMATLGTSRALLLESAQLRAVTGKWREAAEAWRETMRDQAYFESAAVFSLQPAPEAQRDIIRQELRSADAPIGALQALALLELAWGSPRGGWQVLAALPGTDTTVAVWGVFAEEAEREQAWSAARDALVAMHGVTRNPATAERGALAALRANDPETALSLARAARRPGEAIPRPEVLSAELEALARLGRGAEAERALATSGVSESVARGHARTIAWAWVRAGDVTKARAALANAPLEAEDAVAGWLALFEGNLTVARRALREGDAAAPQAVAALALLSRTAAQRSERVGRAFLQLVRADSAGAAVEFERAAAELPDAAPLLLTMAARVETARGAEARAIQLWSRVATEFAAAPEAPEARLEWGRALRRRGDRGGAREQFEHLILTYPGSALVPQARRELDALPSGRAGTTP